jgi:thiol-disulfide isomerase/thioredoxin
MAERIIIALALAALGYAAYVLFQRWHMARASLATIPAGRPALLYFASEQCGPCVTQARFVEQVSQQYGERLRVEKIDAIVESEKADRYGVFTVPTTLVVDELGTVRHANYGLADTRKLSGQLEDVIGE